MSKIEVNQISSQCGSTLTIGQSGDTVTLACGATQTGFGRTGTVDWNTTAITADPANAVSGTGYFANTTSAAFTITLPTSPSAGDIVAVRDYAQTFATNNLTIGRNSQPIDGQTFDLVLSTNGQSVTLVYVDGTQGWKSVNSNETVNQALYVTATGGTETTCGNYKIHTFTGPGTFFVSCAGNAAGSTTVDYLIVAGGGGGGAAHGAGGGAGGYRESSGAASGCYSVSPLGACVSALPVSTTSYPISVGGGGVGAGGPTSPNFRIATSGSNSVFSTITSAGGGLGGGYCGSTNRVGGDGGSGGGGGNSTSGLQGGAAGGSGNTPPVSPPQGNDGGHGGSDDTTFRGGGGGGGATTAGGDVTPTSPPGNTGNVGPGGSGATSSINTTPTTRAGGGGGGSSNVSGTGGPGGGGAGTFNGSCGGAPVAPAGTTNTGGGGGGGGGNCNQSGGAGGSGIVIIRYKYQ
jgi:hypothetical protein